MRYIQSIVDLTHNRKLDKLTVSLKADSVHDNIIAIIYDTDTNTRADYYLRDELKLVNSLVSDVFGVFRDTTHKLVYLFVIPPADAQVLSCLHLTRCSTKNSPNAQYNKLVDTNPTYLFDLEGLLKTPKKNMFFATSFLDFSSIVSLGTVIRSLRSPIWLSNDKKTLCVEVVIEHFNPKTNIKKSEVTWCYFDIVGTWFQVYLEKFSSLQKEQ